MKNKIKTCSNCHFFTGIQCHGHGEYWGECKKNKNTLFCYPETPCLQDIKIMRELYFKYKEKADKLEIEKTEKDIYKFCYESKCRTVKKYQHMYHLALEFLNPKRKKEFSKKIIEFLTNYEIPHIKKPKT